MCISHDHRGEFFERPVAKFHHEVIMLTIVATADRLEEATHTLRCHPKIKVQGFKSNWPPTVNEYHEPYGYNVTTVRLDPSSAKHITEMDQARIKPYRR